MPKFTVVPPRKADESEDDYQKRLKALEAAAAQEGGPDPKKDDDLDGQHKKGGVSFEVPPQYKEFAKYAAEHPEANWHMSSSPDGVEKMLDDLKNHPDLKNLGIKIQGIHLENCEDKVAARGAMKALQTEGLLDKLKDVKFEKSTGLDPLIKGADDGKFNKALSELNSKPTRR
jgi:hypothetical protein